MFPIGVEWIDGPHDGLAQAVSVDTELPAARVCHCHGALYIADPFDGARWVLRFAEHWETASMSAEEAVSRA